MDRHFGECHYRSHRVEDRTDGYAGFELVRTQHGQSDRVAQILFWDACGQFYVETFGCDIPLEILEELAAEARAELGTG